MTQNKMILLYSKKARKFVIYSCELITMISTVLVWDGIIYVDGDWNLQKHIIGFLLWDVAHNDRNISEWIMNILVNYDLHKRIIAIKFDNASTNNIAIEIMRLFLSGFHNELFHVR